MNYAEKIEALVAERDALRKDAERYRYLRKHFASVGIGGVELIWDQPDPCDALDVLVDYEMLHMPAVGAA